MPAILKDVLWPGSWSFPDGRKLTLTGNDIRNALKQGAAMLARNLDVPWCWEHQPDCEPRPVEMSSAIYGDKDKRAAWAKNTIAPVAGYVLGCDKRGPVLYASIDSENLDPKEIEQIRKTGKVSCRVDRNFRDARDGRVFAGFTVSHIAVTPKPLEPDQGPFQMSQSSDATFYLGQAEGGTVADENEKTDPPAEDKPPVEEKPPETPEADSAGLLAVIEALRASGMAIPDEVVDAAGLVIAIKAIGAMPKPNEDPLGDVTGDTTAANSPPMMMSQAAYAKERPAIVAGDRREIDRRIKELVRTGRVAPPVAAALTRSFGAFQLSYTADGNVAEVGLLAKLKAYEELPANTVMKSKENGYELSATNAVDPPADLNQQSSMEEVLAEQRRLAGRNSAVPPKKTAAA